MTTPEQPQPSAPVTREIPYPEGEPSVGQREEWAQRMQREVQPSPEDAARLT